MNVNGKLFLITGASSGIGAATARAAAAQGARVVLLARSAGKLHDLAGEITRSGGSACPYALDLTDAATVQDAARQIMRQAGVPDVILNNAGAGRWLSTCETSPGQAAAMMAAPYFAAFNTTRAFLPAMLARNSGVIANLTSAAAYLAIPGATTYSAARWAMRGFNEALRADLRRSGLRVMLVAFAKVESSYFANNPGTEERIPQAQAMIPVLTPAAAAAAILNGIHREQREVIAPFMLRFVLLLNRFFPRTTEGIMDFGSQGRSMALPSGE